MTGAPTGPTHQASGDERQRRDIKLPKNTYNELYMCKNIKARLYIEFVLTVLIFGVLKPIIQVYNDINRGSSAVSMSSRY